MIKHKREVFLSDPSHRSLVISGLFFGCAAADSLVIYGKMKEAMPNSSGILIPAALFAVLSVFFLLRGMLKAGKRKKRAMESRHNYLQNGIVSHGKITAAGGGYYQKRHYRQQYPRQHESRYFHIWESRWWADIEYYNETKGIYARHRVIDLNQNPKLHPLAGKEVALYRLEDSVYVDFQ